ncbi:glycosyltransferase [Sphingomonas pituitosa]|uniref:glycosyltransferase n=1 Tax=Sphingomonas pituitosa TaxID=99597 RepID=UPI000835961B|nr:glycosyltransferase [Sphingomonas pituitosa]
MIVILTYGKIYTTSLIEMMTSMFPGDVFSSHVLQPAYPQLIEAYGLASETDLSGLRHTTTNHRIRQRLERAERTGETVTFLTGVRDPVTRSLSVAMQLYAELFRHEGDAERDDAEIARRIGAEIADLWQNDTIGEDPRRRLAEATIRYPLTWFEQELAEPFGFDLFGTPFDASNGYSVFTNGNKRLLLFRYENGADAVERGLCELFPGHAFRLPHANDGDAKHTASIYRHLRECFRMPRAALEAIYRHPAVAHFYDEAHREAAIARWAGEPPADSASIPIVHDNRISPPLRATVLIPLYNNAAFIGAQLDSIFAQWRPDLELLVVDDASTDGGLEIVLDKLAGRPDIVATILRHESNCVHATLHDIAKHARGTVIIQADSDDIMLPGRIETTLRVFEEDRRCRLVTGNALMISDTGLPLGLYDSDPEAGTITRPDDTVRKWGSRWIGATSAYHRSVIDAFEPVDPELCPYGFDWLTPLRATLLGTHHHLAEPLVAWRQHRNNSHRLTGSLSSHLQHQERNVANELMGMAQRIRDVRWVQEHRYVPDADMLDDALALSESLFFRTFEGWARLRSKMQAAISEGAVSFHDQRGIRPPPGVPTIMTLSPGQRYRIGRGEPLASALTAWNGFHAIEEGHVWTSRCAAFAFRIADPAVNALAITLGGSLFFPPQTALVSINLDAPVRIDLPGDGGATHEIPWERARVGSLPWSDDIVVVTISVPTADKPVNLWPEYPDARTLGAALFALEPIIRQA